MRTEKSKALQKLQSTIPVTSPEGPVRTANITLIADSKSVTVKWNITVVPETDKQLKSSQEEICLGRSRCSGGLYFGELRSNVG